jgi:ABC-2 type transport system ATP-binding protein
LDEPTRSIDPEETKRIWSLLRDNLVRQQGMTVVVVTHNVEEAVALCDRIAILENGKLRPNLKPAEIAQAADGLHGLTLTLTGFELSSLPQIKLIRGVKDVSFSEDRGEQQLEVWCDNGDLAIAEVVALTTRTGAQLRSLVQGTPVHEIVSRLIQNGSQN